MGFLDKLFGSKRIKPWKMLDTVQQVKDAIDSSYDKPCIILKYNPLVFAGEFLLMNTEDQVQKIPEYAEANYFLLNTMMNSALVDVLIHKFEFPDENPQFLIIRNDRLIFNKAHEEINLRSILKQIREQYTSQPRPTSTETQ